MSVQRYLNAVIFSLFAVFSLAVTATAAQSNAAPPAVPVTVAEVLSERISEWDEFTGRLEAPEVVMLRPRVSGYINKVSFTEGSMVTEGQLLFQIDPAPFAAEVARLEANLQQAESRYELALKLQRRGKDLVQKRAISLEEMDRRDAEVKTSRALIKSTKASLELAQLNLSYTEVRAPISGRVSRAMITKGNFVTAGQSTLTTLASQDKTYAYFNVDERSYLTYAASNFQGMKAQAVDAKAGAGSIALLGLATDESFPHQGNVDFIDNWINPETGTIRARAVFDNKQGQLMPGLFARIRLVSSDSYTGILIADRAIGTDLSNKFVLVLDQDNKVQYRPVQLGERYQGLRLIKSGLKAGEKVVVNGLQRVRPGSLVMPELVPMADKKLVSQIKRLQALVDNSQSQLAGRDATTPAENAAEAKGQAVLVTPVTVTTVTSPATPAGE